MILVAVQGMLRSLRLAGRRALGLSVSRHTEDRRVLEQVILPAYASRTDIQRVLFVGCAAYTQRYGEVFSAREYWTIDPAARRRRYGSRHHIVDRLENLGHHVKDEYFDLIICNGVLGWGLNTPGDADAAFASCHQCLQRGGVLVLGWNDVTPRNQVRPEAVSSLRRFHPHVFEPLKATRFTIEARNRHTFDFYSKP